MGRVREKNYNGGKHEKVVTGEGEKMVRKRSGCEGRGGRRGLSRVGKKGEEDDVRLGEVRKDAVAVVTKVGEEGCSEREDVGVVEEGVKEKLVLDTCMGSRKLVRVYRSNTNDMSWARNGVVATVHNGESIPIIQTRIMDARFEDLNIIPMGVDKVFVSSLSNLDVQAAVTGAKEFLIISF